MYPRPLYVWAVGAFVVIYGLLALLAGFVYSNRTPDANQTVFLGGMIVSMAGVVLGVLIIKGVNWARWVFTVICALGSLVFAWFALNALENGIDLSSVTFIALMFAPWVLVTFLFLPAANQFFRDPLETVRPPGALFAMNRRAASSEMLPESSKRFLPDKPAYLAIVGTVFLALGEVLLIRLIPTDPTSPAFQNFDPTDFGFLFKASTCLGLFVSSIFLLYGSSWARWLLVLTVICIEIAQIFFGDIVPAHLRGWISMTGLKDLTMVLAFCLLIIILFVLPSVRRYYTEREL